MECSRCGEDQTNTHQVWHQEAETPTGEKERHGLCDVCYTQFLQFMEKEEALNKVALEDYREKPAGAGIDRIE